MKRFFVCVTALLVSLPLSAESLAEFIERRTSEPPFDHALWGIVVEEEDGTVLYAKNPKTLMMPASNRKLFSAAFAVECNGISSIIETTVAHTGRIRSGTVDGDIVIIGAGDPSLGGRYYFGRDGALLPVVDELRRRGIERIRGRIIADVSRFDGTTIPGSWKYDNLGASYAAPVDALAWNENVAGVRISGDGCRDVVVTTDPQFVEVRRAIVCDAATDLAVEPIPGNRLAVRGSVRRVPEAEDESDLPSITDPALYAAQALDDLLRRHGIRVDGEPAVSRSPVATNGTVAVLRSPLMHLLASTVLKNSQNLYAEMLLKRGAAGGSPASYTRALDLERRLLSDVAGVPADEIAFADGSGLSVENHVTPNAVIRLLRFMAAPERRGIYSQILATPGEDGTLRRRLGGLEARMRGKTGTIDHVNALSGWIVMPDGRLRFFSLFANHHTGASRNAVAILDSIVQRIAEGD